MQDIPDPASIEDAIARLPRWLLGLALAGTATSGAFLGLSWAGGFLTGSLAAWANLKLIERAASRLTARSGAGTGVWVFVQFAGMVLGAFVILKYSGFNMAAAFCGFLVCPAAVVIEIVYELATLNFQK